MARGLGRRTRGRGALNPDQRTADAFASSWNNLPGGSVYTPEDVADWMAPLAASDFAGASVLEMGCGNGSLMVHALRWSPARLDGIDLGASIESAERNLAATGATGWSVRRADLTTFESDGYDVVYSIGVLHHLDDPRKGFEAVVRNARPGGRFHCWVYGREGNAVVRMLVDPLRRLTSKLPWWLVKYGIATPLVLPYFVYAKLIAAAPPSPALARLPLHDYSRWIARHDFRFFRHVAFDQLVAPRTTYLPRAAIESWLRSNPRVLAESAYVIARNGNSWKFGARVR
jgi:SAM-dependent methyltransferase